MSKNTKILGTGLTGLVGSRIVELLGDRYIFENISRETGVDITDEATLSKSIDSSDANIILHVVAKTDVDGCELDKTIDTKILRYADIKRQKEEWMRLKTAWAVNVLGTENIVNACKQAGKKLIYISTDFVFDGTKTVYNEEDSPNPLSWYGKTKYEGEEVVKKSGIDYLILRIAYPYRAQFAKKIDFARAIKARLTDGKTVMALTDHIMTPTFVDDIASAIDALIQKDATGIFHVVGSQSLTPYEACISIAKTFGLDPALITKTTRDEYFKGKAQRAFHLALKNDKIQKLAITMRTFEEGLEEISKQLMASG